MFQTADPFLSSDISAGSVWFDEIGGALRSSAFSIICVTPHNLASPWLHFEAGAIGMAHGNDAKAVPRNVVPYLLDVTPTELAPPLSLYQAVSANREGTKGLALAVNQRVPAPVPGLDRTFDKWWPELAVAIDAALKVAAEDPPARPERDVRDLLEEVLAHVRRAGVEEARANRGPAPPDLTQVQIQAAVEAVLVELGIRVSALPTAGNQNVSVYGPDERTLQDFGARIIEIFNRYGLNVVWLGEEPF